MSVIKSLGGDILFLIYPCIRSDDQLYIFLCCPVHHDLLWDFFFFFYWISVSAETFSEIRIQIYFMHVLNLCKSIYNVQSSRSDGSKVITFLKYEKDMRPNQRQFTSNYTNQLTACLALPEIHFNVYND